MLDNTNIQKYTKRMQNVHDKYTTIIQNKNKYVHNGYSKYQAENGPAACTGGPGGPDPGPGRRTPAPSPFGIFCIYLATVPMNEWFSMYECIGVTYVWKGFGIGSRQLGNLFWCFQSIHIPVHDWYEYSIHSHTYTVYMIGMTGLMLSIHSHTSKAIHNELLNEFDWWFVKYEGTC